MRKQIHQMSQGLMFLDGHSVRPEGLAKHDAAAPRPQRGAAAGGQIRSTAACVQRGRGWIAVDSIALSAFR